ncbi:hypothetical protein ACTMU2_11735 [Cupriavidus basilensis]
MGCVGTGGSMTGIARGVKQLNPDAVTMAVEPSGSIVFGMPGHPYYRSASRGTPQGDTVGHWCLDYSQDRHGGGRSPMRRPSRRARLAWSAGDRAAGDPRRAHRRRHLQGAGSHP